MDDDSRQEASPWLPVRARAPAARCASRTKLWFGVGQIAEGVESRAFETFLFFYYEQVLGLGAGLSAAALALAVLRNASVAPVLNEVSAGARGVHQRRVRTTMTRDVSLRLEPLVRTPR